MSGAKNVTAEQLATADIDNTTILPQGMTFEQIESFLPQKNNLDKVKTADEGNKDFHSPTPNKIGIRSWLKNFIYGEPKKINAL